MSTGEMIELLKLMYQMLVELQCFYVLWCLEKSMLNVCANLYVTVLCFPLAIHCSVYVCVCVCVRMRAWCVCACMHVCVHACMRGC